MKYVSFIANWVLGILFLIVSLLAILNSSIVAGLFLLIASLTLIPISRNFVLSKINKKMSPMIRATFVSVLFVGFVVSLQPNEAQLLKQKELKLAEEAAVKEQQQIAEAAGFISIDNFKKAQSVQMPTKVLYDAYLLQQSEVEKANDNYEKYLSDNLSNLGEFLRCTRLGARSAAQRGEMYWIGMNKDGNYNSEFRFPTHREISTEDNTHEIRLHSTSAFMAYDDSLKPNSFVAREQYSARVEATPSSYKFSGVRGDIGAQKTFSINRETGVLLIHTEFSDMPGANRFTEYQCNPVAKSNERKLFTSLYNQHHNQAVNALNSRKAYLDEQRSNQKF
jgi:hypothetical protein